MGWSLTQDPSLFILFACWLPQVFCYGDAMWTLKNGDTDLQLTYSSDQEECCMEGRILLLEP